MKPDFSLILLQNSGFCLETNFNFEIGKENFQKIMTCLTFCICLFSEVLKLLTIFSKCQENSMFNRFCEILGSQIKYCTEPE